MSYQELKRRLRLKENSADTLPSRIIFTEKDIDVLTKYAKLHPDWVIQNPHITDELITYIIFDAPTKKRGGSGVYYDNYSKRGIIEGLFRNPMIIERIRKNDLSLFVLFNRNIYKTFTIMHSNQEFKDFIVKNLSNEELEEYLHFKDFDDEELEALLKEPRISETVILHLPNKNLLNEPRISETVILHLPNKNMKVLLAMQANNELLDLRTRVAICIRTWYETIDRIDKQEYTEFIQADQEKVATLITAIESNLLVSEIADLEHLPQVIREKLFFLNNAVFDLKVFENNSLTNTECLMLWDRYKDNHEVTFKLLENRWFFTLIQDQLDLQNITTFLLLMKTGNQQAYTLDELYNLSTRYLGSLQDTRTLANNLEFLYLTKEQVLELLRLENELITEALRRKLKRSKVFDVETLEIIEDQIITQGFPSAPYIMMNSIFAYGVDEPDLKIPLPQKPNTSEKKLN